MAEPLKIELPPGLARGGTPYSYSIGRWYDAQFITFVDGVIKPEKGWDLAFDTAPLMEGHARVALSWKDNEEDSFLAIVTHSHLYTHNGTTLDDITPSGFVAGDSNTSQWTLDNYGELLIACNDSTNSLYEWQPDGGGDATLITNSPNCSAAFSSPEQFIIALGADDDPRKISWPDGTNRTTWTPTLSNRARSVYLQTPGRLMCGSAIRGGSLIWSDADLWFLRYIGLPDVYAADRVASNCGIIGRHAFQVVDSLAFWMGQNRFWRYMGYVEPIPCEIADDVFTNINTTHRHKTWCRHDPEHGEIHWHYPRGSATECSHRVKYNYRENHWNHDALPRKAGVPIGVFDNPLMITAEGRIMKHDYGYDYDESVFLLDDNGDRLLDDDGVTYLTDDPGDAVAEPSRYLISGPIELGSGERRLMVSEIVPDEQTQGDCSIYLYGREYPNASETTYGPYTASDRIGILATMRQVRLELRADNDVDEFRIGAYRAFVTPRGRY